jgi:hypothetical protein
MGRVDLTRPITNGFHQLAAWQKPERLRPKCSMTINARDANSASDSKTSRLTRIHGATIGAPSISQQSEPIAGVIGDDSSGQNFKGGFRLSGLDAAQQACGSQNAESEQNAFCFSRCHLLFSLISLCDSISLGRFASVHRLRCVNE